MQPKIAVFLFSALFVVTIGVAALGLLTSFNLNKSYKRFYLQPLLYHQIFLYTFFLYGVWGRIFMAQVLAGFEVSQEIIGKVSFIALSIGLPFLILNWYMLARFFYESRNRKIPKSATILYFPACVLLIFAGTWIINSGGLNKLGQQEVLLIRLLAVVNLAANLFIIFPALLEKSKPSGEGKFRIPLLFLMIYLGGILLYSTGLWFIKIHSLVSAFTILSIFVVSSLIPVFTSFIIKNTPAEDTPVPHDFESFCLKYEISKREAEIVLQICSGKSNQDIADALFITLQTVKDHTHRIFTKIGIKNRVHLINLVNKKLKQD